MLDDILKELLEGLLYHSIVDSKARHNKQLKQAREQMTTSEKTACYIICYTAGVSALVTLVIIPLYFNLQGTFLLELWAWGFLVHFLLSELMILIVRAIKKNPQLSLRRLLFIRYCIRPFWLHVARWFPLILSLSFFFYLGYF